MGAGGVETEVKLRMGDPETARRAVAALGAKPRRVRHFEDNLLLDSRERDLLARGSVLRLRRTEGEAVITFKGPREDAGGLKRRLETEFVVSDADAAESVLLALGFLPVFRYQKFREVFTWQDAEIVVDETPIGTFLEIEGSPETIHAAARALGRSPADYVTASYVALFLEAGGTGDMVFR